MTRLHGVLIICGLAIAGALSSWLWFNQPISEPTSLTTPVPSRSMLYVSPTGTDAADHGTREKPYNTISFALKQVVPGGTVTVLPGTYPEYIYPIVQGQSDAPITLKAEGTVHLTGDATHGRIFELDRSYYVIDGFELSGKDILLWVQGGTHNLIRNNYFHHALGECVRMKYHASHNTFTRNKVEHCGLEDFTRGGGGKNGEGIYLGTAPEQLERNPSPERDGTNNNVISYNYFSTFGNECVDIKEGSSFNIVEFNECTNQQDPESAGLDSRGDNNIFRYNKSFGNKGAGIRFGGDEETDGINNEAYGNELRDNTFYALKIVRLPQGTICGNTDGNNSGFSNQKELENIPCSFPLSPPGITP